MTNGIYLGIVNKVGDTPDKKSSTTYIGKFYLGPTFPENIYVYLFF